MATVGDGFKSIFLAGIGAMAIGAEKGKDLVDSLIARGELTVDQGKQVNEELRHRANEVEQTLRCDAIEARMAAMTPQKRTEFAAQVAQMAERANVRDAASAAAKVEGSADEPATATAAADDATPAVSADAHTSDADAPSA